MIDNKVFNLIKDVIKAMKSDRYILMNGYIVGAKVQKNKLQYDVIESISYVEVGLSLDRMYSFSGDNFRELLKVEGIDKLDSYDNIFNDQYNDPLVYGNLQLYRAFENIMNILRPLTPDYVIENLKENERWLNSSTRVSKYGLDFVKIDGRLIPAYKGICSATKPDTVTLNLYDNVLYTKYGYNSTDNRPTIIADYIVNKKKYRVHNLYRMIL